MAKRHGKRRGKVICPKCGQEVTLNSRGLIKSHSIDLRWDKPQCEGTHKKPSGIN